MPSEEDGLKSKESVRGKGLKKDIKPEDQTKELTKARVEFAKRNEEERQEIEEALKRNEEERDKFTNYLTCFGGNGKLNKELKESWDFLFRKMVIDPVLAQKKREIEVPSAAKANWYYMDFFIQEFVWKQRNLKKLSHDTINAEFIGWLCHHARKIFTELTDERPTKHLLIGIDLTRTKEAILAEVADLVTLYQTRTGVTERRKERLKWLPIVDELLEVWDLYEKAGQQLWKTTFNQISKKVNRPLSTVKDQWYAAYEKIYGKPYSPESLYATEETRHPANSPRATRGMANRYPARLT